jgi:hypothetical protein
MVRFSKEYFINLPLIITRETDYSLILMEVERMVLIHKISQHFDWLSQPPPPIINSEF